MTTDMSRADFPSSEGAVQGRWSGVNQLSSSFVDQDLQMDENLGYGQKHVTFEHLNKNISYEFVEGSCPLV